MNEMREKWLARLRRPLRHHRLCRIGQKNAVVITRLVAPHPLDAQVEAILRRKQELIERTLGA